MRHCIRREHVTTSICKLASATCCNAVIRSRSWRGLTPCRSKAPSYEGPALLAWLVAATGVNFCARVSRQSCQWSTFELGSGRDLVYQYQDHVMRRQSPSRDLAPVHSTAFLKLEIPQGLYTSELNHYVQRQSMQSCNACSQCRAIMSFIV